MVRALVLGFVLGAGTVYAQPTNIVFILVDDENVPVMNASLPWMTNLQTHVINRGTTFSNSFDSVSLCCPSRATILTGQYAHNHGVKTNVTPYGFPSFVDTSTLATWLQTAGYRTGLIGKYLNGYPAGSVYVPPGWNSFQAISGANVGMYGYQLNDNGVSRTYGSLTADYQTDVFAGMASTFITSSTTPFFLYVAPSAPHMSDTVLCSLPYGTIGTVQPAPRHIGLAAGLVFPQPPSYNEAVVTDKPAWLKNNFGLLSASQTTCLGKVYRDQVEAMMAVDDLIGTVVSALTVTGHYADTAIVITSDNGYQFGEHRVTQKEFAYEESIRVPLYITAPGHTTLQATTRFAINNDYAPTFLEMAGLPVPATVDGRSLVPLLTNPATLPWRKQFLVEHWTSTADPVLTGYRALRTDTSATSAPNELWVRYGTTDREFYDLTADPYQLVSRHLCTEAPCSTQKAYLDGLLTSFLTCAGATCRSLEDQ
jgi:N-acetylglucosamine-6-sulfatase